MIPIIPLLFIGALTFVEQNVTDDFNTSYRQADLDQDGKLDLILPSAIYFQRNGGFSHEGRVSFPDFGEPPTTNRDWPPYVDVWKDTLFIWTAKQLYLVRWEGGTWRVLHTQPLARPDAIEQPTEPRPLPPGPTPKQEAYLGRFLHDLNADGVPELVMPQEDGLHIYSRGDGGYAEAGKLDVFPAFQIDQERVPARFLWPETERRLAFPERRMDCRCVFEQNKLMAIARENSGREVRYRVKRFEIDPAFAVIPDKTREEVTEPLPGWVRPLFIGKDGRVEYGGNTIGHSETSVIPTPFKEAHVTFDAGKTFQIIRSISINPVDSFLDFDGDGNLDIVTENTDLFDGGVRETVARLMTAREMSGELRIYLQGPPGKFPEKPDIMFPFRVTLDASMLMATSSLGRTKPFSLDGDFNGDKHRDLLLARNPGELAIHLFDGNSFRKTPAAVLYVKEGEFYEIADFDGDGRSDILLLRLYRFDTSAPEYLCRLFLAREDAP